MTVDRKQLRELALKVIGPEYVPGDVYEYSLAAHPKVILELLDERDALAARVAALHADAAQTRERERALREALATAARQLYNGFEPDNQSAAYKRVRAALDATPESAASPTGGEG